MKKVCIFTLYPPRGASSKYRIFLYKKELESKFEIKWFPFWNDAYTKEYMHHKKDHLVRIFLLYCIGFIKRLTQLFFFAPRADVCFFQKACIPKFRFNNIVFLKKKGVRIVFDVDDAVYTSKNDFSDLIAGLSDVVICGNETLCLHYKKFNANVVVLPTVENTNLFRPYWKNTFENKIVGWIGSLATIDNLDLIVNPINEIIKKHPEVFFVIICNTALDYEKKIKHCKFIKWDMETYISDLANITIGIMPLKNSEYNSGKCGFKLVQYLNLKKPVIASDVGVNKDIVGGCGLIAESEQEWYDCFEKLLFSNDEYVKRTENIEKEFFEKYNFDKNANSLISILNG